MTFPHSAYLIFSPSSAPSSPRRLRLPRRTPKLHCLSGTEMTVIHDGNS